MTMEELAKNIVIYFNDEDHDFTEENINNFCNIYATSYEEYMYIYELLMDSNGDLMSPLLCSSLDRLLHRVDIEDKICYTQRIK